MPIKAPAKLFRLEFVDVVKVEREITNAPTIQYVDREVIKEIERVVYKEDPALLLQLNTALRENGALRTELHRKPKDAEPIVEYRDVEISADQYIPESKGGLMQSLMLLLAGGFVGAAICQLIH